jgi:hypothetical protein
LVAVHVRFVPVGVVSPVTASPGSHPLVGPAVEPFQLTLQPTMTWLTYQPFWPAVPESVYVMIGGAADAVDAMRATNAAASASPRAIIWTSPFRVRSW